MAWEQYGSEAAFRTLFEGPPLPEALVWLLQQAYAMVGRSGEGMNGAAPLRWSELAAYQAETGWHFTAGDKDVLMQLDSIIRRVARAPVPTQTQQPIPGFAEFANARAGATPDVPSGEYVGDA